MIPHRRIMLACMADNPGADVAALRREFICRVLAEHPLVACRILGQYATKLHQRVVTEASVRAAQSEFFEERTQRAEAYRAELLRRSLELQ